MSDKVKNTVLISCGIGNLPVEVECSNEGETIKVLLDRADLVLGEGATVCLGSARVDDIAKVIVKPGDVVVIAGKLANG